MPNYQAAAAAFKEGEAILKRYIESNGNNPNAVVDNSTGESYLHGAAREGNLALLQALLLLGADKNLQAIRMEIVQPDVVDDDHVGASKAKPAGSGMTALHIAAEQGHFLLVEYLVTQGADCNCQDNEGMTPLMKALSSFALAEEKKRSLLEEIVDFFAQNNSLDLEKVDRQRSNILHYAAGIRNTVVLEKILGKLKQRTLAARTNFSSFLNARDMQGDTPLSRAIAELQVGNIQCLLNAGAHPFAGLSNSADVWHSIIERSFGENANNRDIKSQVLKVFLIALGSPHENVEHIANSLLNISTDRIDNNLKNNITSILKEKNAKAQRFSIAAYLLWLNIMPCLAIAASDVLLSLANEQTHDAVIESDLNKILKDPNYIIVELARRKIYPKSAIMFTITVYLVQIGIDSKRVTGSITALTDIALKGYDHAFNQQLASLRKNSATEVRGFSNFLFEMVQSPATDASLELLSALDADYQDEQGRSLLHCAAAAGNVPHVKKLSAKSRDLNIGDHERNTSLHLAAQAGHVSVYYYLRGKGADTRKKNNAQLTPFQCLSLTNRLLLGLRIYAVELLILLGLFLLISTAAVLVFTPLAPTTVLSFALGLGITKLEVFGIAVGALCTLALIAEGVSLLINHVARSKINSLPSPASTSPIHSPLLKRDLKPADKSQEALGSYAFDCLGLFSRKKKTTKNTSPTDPPGQRPAYIK